MNESTLQKVSLICSMIGIFALFLLSKSISIDQIDISRITLEDIGISLDTEGKVTRVMDREGVSIISLKDASDSEISLVVFKKQDQEYKSLEGKNIIVRGSVEEYNGKPEIIASEIRVK